MGYVSWSNSFMREINTRNAGIQYHIIARTGDLSRGKGLHARPRFSPGYGDFPLEVQRDFERILEMPKTIGVTLSDSLLMTPTKSITAVIGLSEIDTNCEKSGCEQCAMAGKCAYFRS